MLKEGQPTLVKGLENKSHMELLQELREQLEMWNNLFSERTVKLWKQAARQNGTVPGDV